MIQAKYPSLYQVNTRVWLTEIGLRLNRSATLDDIPDKDLDQFAELGFDWIWFLSVWTTGKLAQKISRELPEWRRDFENTLNDLKEDDIAGSGFAIADYKVHPNLGGDAALKRLHDRLNKRGLKLMLDFVPNHMGPDHHWLENHPEYFIKGSEDDLNNYPQNYTKIKCNADDLVIAYGRDPYFSGWPDTVQIDYSNPLAVEAMKKELLRISQQCDGVRCDMAMLILPNVFERTWGRKALSFWPEIIGSIHEKKPEFCFMAEVYWDMEWDLQQLGFNYTYDKRLYDRLEEKQARPVHEHLYADTDYQSKMARFLENHDESRAAKTFNPDEHKAAALITFLSPGLRFFHQGQFEGRSKRISPHLIRAPKEPLIVELQQFYTSLLTILKRPVFRQGKWHLLGLEPAWDGNDSWNSFLAFFWEDSDKNRILLVVNYAPHSSQCCIDIPFPELIGKTIIFSDLLNSSKYDRDGGDLLLKGLYVDLPAWGYHIFEISELIVSN